MDREKEYPHATDDVAGFCERLASLCSDRGITVSEAVKMAGLQRSTPYMWFKGKCPSRTSASRLATVLCTTPTYLLHGTPVVSSVKGLDVDTQQLIYLFCGLNRAQRKRVIDFAAHIGREPTESKMLAK